MRRMAKIVAGIALPLLLLGGILAGVGWAMGAQTSIDVPLAGHTVRVGGLGDLFPRNGKTEYASSAEDLDLAPFTKIETDVALGDVEVVTTDADYGVELRWSGVNYELHYTNEKGLLRVWSTSVAGIDLGRHEAQVTIYVPEGAELEKVDLKSSLGTVSVDGISAKELDVEADLGNVSLWEIEATEAELTLSLGDLDIASMTAEELTAELSMGDMTATGLTTNYYLKVENSMGNIDLEGAFMSECDLSCSMGDVEVATALLEEDYNYELEVDMGTLRINGEKQRDQVERSGGRNSMDLSSDMGDVSVWFGR